MKTQLKGDVDMNHNERNEIINFINNYYSKMDANDSINEFVDLINWDQFEMKNGALVLDSFEKYQTWYAEILVSLLDRKHIIKDLAIDKISDNRYKAEINMYFEGSSVKKGETKGNKIEVNGNIEWILSKENEDNKLKLEKYTISES